MKKKTLAAFLMMSTVLASASVCYAGEVAKEKLGMVGEDEILFRAQN